MISIGRSNLDSVYIIEDQIEKCSQLSAVTSERDLGMVMSRDLKPHYQECKETSNENTMLAKLRNIFLSRDPILWRRLYTAYVTPHLEYAMAAWSRHTKKCYQIIEKFKENAAKTSNLLNKLSYEEELNNLSLMTLKVQRER